MSDQLVESPGVLSDEALAQLLALRAELVTDQPDDPSTDPPATAAPDERWAG